MRVFLLYFVAAWAFSFACGVAVLWLGVHPAVVLVVTVLTGFLGGVAAAWKGLA